MKLGLSILLLSSLFLSGCGTTATPTATLAQSTPTVLASQEPTSTVPIVTSTLDPATFLVTEPSATAESTMTPHATVTIPQVQMQVVPGGQQTAQPQLEVCQQPSNWVAYTVQRSDTLSSLGQRTGTSTQQIQTANCLTGTLIFAGQVLYLPFVPAPQAGTNIPSTGPTATIWTPKAGLPGDHLVNISPSSGPPGTEFTLSVDQYASNEKVIITIISENTNLPVLEQTLYTDNDGNLTWYFKSPVNMLEGAYRVYEDGIQSRANGKGDFSITPPPATTSP